MFGIDDAIIGGAISAIGSGLFGLASAESSGDAAQEAAASANLNSAIQAKLAFERSQEAYGKRYQMTMADMRAAGLNPIMAASGGFNVGNAPQASVPSMFMQSYIPNYASSAKDVGDVIKSGMQAMESASESEVNVASLPKIQAEVAKLNQDVSESFERVFKMRAEQGLITAQEKETYVSIQERLKKIDVMSSEIFKLNQEVRESVSRESLNYSSRALADSNIELNKAKQGEIGALISKLGQETQNLVYESFRLKKESEVYGGPAGSAVAYGEKIGKALPGVGVLIPRAGRFSTKGGR